MSSIIDLDLGGLTVVVKNYADPLCLFRCHAGFGCKPGLMGQSISGEFLSDGEQCSVRRPEVIRVATEEDLARFTEWGKLTMRERWFRQQDCVYQQTTESFEALRQRFGSSRKPTLEDLKNSYSLLWRRYNSLRDLILVHGDYIADQETQ